MNFDSTSAMTMEPGKGMRVPSWHLRPSESVLPASPPKAYARSEPSGAGLRRLVYAIVLVLCWLLFFYWWSVVFRTVDPAVLGTIAIALSVGLAITTVIALWWTRHNLAIARKGQRGLASRYIIPEFRHDSLGRPLRFQQGSTTGHARVVVIDNRDGVKEYFVPAVHGRVKAGVR
jgi:hypothetical protein